MQSHRTGPVNGNNVVTLVIMLDMHCSVSLPQTQKDYSASQFNALYPYITYNNDVQDILKCVNQSKLCVGISDPRLAPVTAKSLQADLVSYYKA